MIKNCMNCGHRRGIGFSTSRCMLSGYYCETERQHPSVCGIDFDRWKPRDSIIDKILRWWDEEDGLE